MYQFSFIPSFQAAADINPSRFISLQSDFSVQQSDGTTPIIGVSGQYTRKFDDTLHAATGETVLVFSVGAYCYLEVAANVSAGQYLKSDAQGRGIPATSGDSVGAIALESAPANALCRVLVWLGTAP